jgi:hypothetical protein
VVFIIATFFIVGYTAVEFFGIHMTLNAITPLAYYLIEGGFIVTVLFALPLIVVMIYQIIMVVFTERKKNKK